MEQVETGPHVASQELGLGETEIDLLAQRAPFSTGDDVLAATAEVALGDAQVQHEGIDRAKARADRQFARGLLFHRHVDDAAIRCAAPRFLDLDVLEEAEGAQIVARTLHQRPVEGVALADHQFATDHGIQGAGVADDIDPVDVDALAFLQIEGHVDRVGLRIGAIGRIDLDKGIARRARREGQGVDGALDTVAFVQIARADRQQALQEVRVEAVVLGDDLDVAELVTVALFQGDRHAESAVVRLELGHRGQDTEVVVAAVRIEFPQLLPVVIQPVGIVVVVRAEQAPPAGLLGDHDVAQVVVREGRVAQEGDGGYAGFRTFIDLEHHVDAVLLQLDQLGRHRGRDATRQAVQFDDLTDVLLNAGAGVDAARLDRDLVRQLLLGEGLVPLERHLVDDRVFNDLDHQVAVRLQAQLHVGEQARARQGADRDVDRRRVDGVARLDRQIGKHGRLVDALIAAHHDAIDDGAILGRSRDDDLWILLRGRSGSRRRLRQGRACQAGGDGQRQCAGSKDTATGSDHEATVVLNHSGNHRGLASAHETSPPRNLKRLSFCRSFQVANNIKLASKARPTRYPAS
ncbi:hypothetical protein D3C72_868390 [compost metagenome]